MALSTLPVSHTIGSSFEVTISVTEETNGTLLMASLSTNTQMMGNEGDAIEPEISNDNTHQGNLRKVSKPRLGVNALYAG